MLGQGGGHSGVARNSVLMGGGGILLQIGQGTVCSVQTLPRSGESVLYMVDRLIEQCLNIFSLKSDLLGGDQ